MPGRNETNMTTYYIEEDYSLRGRALTLTAAKSLATRSQVFQGTTLRVIDSSTREVVAWREPGKKWQS
jgi:hypothetical protein